MGGKHYDEGVRLLNEVIALNKGYVDSAKRALKDIEKARAAEVPPKAPE
jgi:hypothetical protein